MKLDRSRFIQKAHQIYPIRSRARADLLKPPQTVVALVPKVGSVGKHRGAVAAEPFCVTNAVVAGRQDSRRYSEKVPVVQHRFASGGTDGCFGSAGSECRPSSAISRGERAGRSFHFPGRSRETRPVRFVHHGDDPTSTANRLVSDDLFHFESLKRSRNVVLSNMVREGFLR